MLFDREKAKKDLKFSIGLQDIPDEELKNHTIAFNSPVKGSLEMSMNAEDYVNSELDTWEKAWKELDYDMEVSEDVLTVNTDMALLPEVDFEKPVEVPTLRYFYVNMDGVYNTIVINTTVEDHIQQINTIKVHKSFIMERTVDTLTALDIMISYYQWHNWATKQEDVSTGVFDMSQLEDKLNFMFQGADDINVQVKNLVK